MQPDDSSANRVPRSAPDVAAARAEEAAALRELDANFAPGEGKAHLMDLLTGKLDSGVVDNVRHVHIIKFKNPLLQARLDRFYAARTHRFNEERREASVAAARNNSAPVVVVLGNPPNGSTATVLRRRSPFPTNVIVLGISATAETLVAAFAELDRSRELTGDDFDDAQVIGIQAAGATGVDPKYIFHDIMARLRKAPTRQVDGVGNVQAIEMESPPLGPRK